MTLADSGRMDGLQYGQTGCGTGLRRLLHGRRNLDGKDAKLLHCKFEQR